jgi:uncharacterized membrane protein
MSMSMTDRKIEQDVSVLLKAGVLISGAVTLFGGVVFLLRHWNEPVPYQIFHSQPRIDRIVPEILAGALRLRARSIIQLGILLLIATPVARVAFSLVGFALERDGKFVFITAIVLAILLYSLIAGAIVN